VKNVKVSAKESLVPSGDRGFFLPKNPSEFDFVIGLDEVGVACLAGPVVAGAFAYPLQGTFVETFQSSIRIHDSKKLSEVQRETAEDFLRTNFQSQCYSHVAQADVEEIDKINIYHASGLAMSRALFGVTQQIESSFGANYRAMVFIDGNKIPMALRKLTSNLNFQCVVKGDGKIFAVACASIFAKNFRDQMMKDLSEKFPGFGWESNVGYPTPEHKQAILKQGVNEFHRRSFAPVREYLEQHL